MRKIAGGSKDINLVAKADSKEGASVLQGCQPAYQKTNGQAWPGRV